MEPEIKQAVDWLPIVAPIITGAFTLGAVILTNKINAKHTQKLFDQQVKIEANRSRLLKAEALYVKFEKWSKSFSSVCFKAIHLSKVVEQHEILEKSIENNVDVKGEIIDIQMLINIYFPSLKPDLEKVFQARDLCWDNMDELATHPMAPLEMEGNLHSFELCCEELKSKISELTRSL
ncbi:hypothetical protein [Vibrio sinaloensis]|uniref:hypothetical protein n=1 Tax=Photobacterium sp. (strain ATCC 43367) TaxID=379097 RepID=UPI00057D7BA7|nr:hypothetical protein [Vibrio sinaloensis]KHT49866.1 hypothetical protein RJ46_07570 [Vibrio sinaloensis]